MTKEPKMSKEAQDEDPMTTTVVSLRQGGTCDVRIDRRSKWGNPYVIPHDGDRITVIEKYRIWIAGQPDLLAALPELKGKRLGCWCTPLPCHGDVLIELLEERNEG